jgi:spore coat polysaccharide biosynthesis predicted glycosyltransferase SpsG
MRVVFRADASVGNGSGHVMRCLTLAEELTARGHEVELAVTIEGIPWLAGLVAGTGLPVIDAVPDVLDAGAVRQRRPDWVVVDSYRIPSEQIGALNVDVPVLAIVDGETRGIEAALYLEQNLGSENREWPVPAGSRMLAGPTFALVRAAIRAGRRAEPWRITGTPRILAFMGGTDATGAIVPVAAALAALGRSVRATVIAADAHRTDVEGKLAGMPDARILSQSPAIGEFMADADIVISASGTSAWEVGTLGLPSILIAVVGNQRASLAEAVERGFVLGVDFVADGTAASEHVATELARLCDDEALRRSLSETSTAVFDGLGAARVVDAMQATVP